MCADCHELELGPLHVPPAECGSCHDALVPIEGGWAKGCVQAGCHPAGSDLEMHASIDASHAIPAASQATCIGSGCHDSAATTVFEGKSVAEIHSAATTTTPDGTFTRCQVCHAQGATPTADCLTCHPERAASHGYVASAHVADESCVLDCHTTTAGMTELKPLHDAATGTTVACSACHATLVPAFEDLWPVGWDKSCTACHGIADLHPAEAANHTGTDVAYKDASFLGNGCSAEAGHTDMLYCHDINNIAEVHSKMPGNGCEVCHGSGKTPAQECLDCHQTGSATSYSQAASVTNTDYGPGTPSSDVFASTSFTYSPAASMYSAVNSAPVIVPNGTTTSPYLTITVPANTAGGVLFNAPRPLVPANATIMDVSVYAKAQATGVTKKLPAWFRIGGADYLGWGTQQTVPLSPNWLGGSTTDPKGRQLSYTGGFLGYDRTPHNDAYDSIYANPASGGRWTAAQLNGTAPSYNLDAFGVYIPAAAGAATVKVAQLYLSIDYYVAVPGEDSPTVGTTTYHHNNAKYLVNPADAAGRRFAVFPPSNGVNGQFPSDSTHWYEALYYQDCFDFCHRGNYGAPTFAAEQGEWMWYSVGGDPSAQGNPVRARTLTLREITVPTASPALDFRTQYILGTGDTGAVEISTNGGGTWTPLEGTVGGSSLSTLSGSSAGWVSASYDLSAYAGQSARLRFNYYNAAGSGAAGWAFDTLEITGDGATLFSDNAETLKPDWTNSRWTRAMGAFPY